MVPEWPWKIHLPDQSTRQYQATGTFELLMSEQNSATHQPYGMQHHNMDPWNELDTYFTC